MTQRNPDRRLDFEALRHAIERSDPDLMLRFYAEDAWLSIVNALTPHADPFELRGKGEIAKHLRATFGQEASHRVERDAAVGEDRVTFREACEYSDGARVWVETSLEVLDGKIVRQVDVVANDARNDETRGERSGTADLKYNRRGGHGCGLCRPGFCAQASHREGGSKMMSSLSSVVRRHPIITFFVLSYALAWMLVPFGSFGAYGPLVAALIVIPITQGVAGLKELGLRVIRWRVRWYWYAVALGVPLAVHLAVVGLNVATGAGVPVADVHLLDHLPHGVRDPPGQPDGRAAGRESGLARLRPPGAAGIGVLAASCHHDRGAARIPLALAPLLLGAGRLAGVRPRGWPRGDDGGDVLLQLALQPHRRQRAPASSWRTTWKEASSTRSAGSLWAFGVRLRSGWSSST